MNFDSMENPARRLRAAEAKRVADLQTENAFLREALEHFLFCRSCEVDEDFKYCELGQDYFQRLGLYVANAKAV